MLNIFQRGHQTDFPVRMDKTSIPERGRSDLLGWALARINLRDRIAFCLWAALNNRCWREELQAARLA